MINRPKSRLRQQIVLQAESDAHQQLKTIYMRRGQEQSDRNFESEGIAQGKIGKLVQNVKRMGTERRINEDLGRHNGTCSCTKTFFISLSTDMQGHCRVARL